MCLLCARVCCLMCGSRSKGVQVSLSSLSASSPSPPISASQLLHSRFLSMCGSGSVPTIPAARLRGLSLLLICSHRTCGREPQEVPLLMFRLRLLYPVRCLITSCPPKRGGYLFFVAEIQGFTFVDLFGVWWNPPLYFVSAPDGMGPHQSCSFLVAEQFNTVGLSVFNNAWSRIHDFTPQTSDFSVCASGSEEAMEPGRKLLRSPCELTSVSEQEFLQIDCPVPRTLGRSFSCRIAGTRTSLVVFLPGHVKEAIALASSLGRVENAVVWTPLHCRLHCS